MRFFGVCKKISVTLHSVFHSIIKIKVSVYFFVKRGRLFLYPFMKIPLQESQENGDCSYRGSARHSIEEAWKEADVAPLH